MEQLTRAAQFPIDNLDAAMAVAIAAGTLYCFLGYRLFRLILFLTGFILAGSVAGGGAAYLSNENPWISVGAGLLGGLAGASAMVFVYRAGVFCVGALGGVVVALHLLTGTEQGWVFWAVLGAGLAMGVLALVIERFVMTLATAAIGAWALTSGLAYFVFDRGYVPSTEEPVLLGDNHLLFVASWLTLALLGSFFQFTSVKRADGPAKES